MLKRLQEGKIVIFALHLAFHMGQANIIDKYYTSYLDYKNNGANQFSSKKKKDAD